MSSPPQSAIDPTEAVLFPNGTVGGGQLETVFEQYKLYVDTMEKLVARRQTAHTVFLSANAFLTAAGGLLLTKEFLDRTLVAVGLVAVAVAGTALSLMWRRLSIHYGLINRAKFAVIYEFERHLPASPFKAEWVSLGEGKDPQKYRSMALLEASVPFVFIVAYLGLSLVAVINASGITR
jgi:hypothetical protein